MVSINGLSNSEKSILTLFAKEKTTKYCLAAIKEDLNLNIKETEKIINGLVKKGMAKLIYENNPAPYDIYCLMEYGISNNQYVDLKKLEEADLSARALRDSICP